MKFHLSIIFAFHRRQTRGETKHGFLWVAAYGLVFAPASCFASHPWVVPLAMAVMLALADWFDYLRENDVYDNTRIIVASDHGRGLGHMKEMTVALSEGKMDLEFYLPLLMVKDFGSHGFTTSEEFMTNADVPTLATAGLIENPVNPFTGKAINSEEKTAHDQYVCFSSEWNADINNGNTFLPSQWASVRDNPWDLSNWTFYNGELVLDRHAAPQ